MPNCLVVQHLEPEKPFAIADALSYAGVEIVVRRAYAGDVVPGSTEGFDGVVVMGGPMSARTDDGFPTRLAEIALLADALEREVPTLGVCLGAQLLAAAAGGRVLPGNGQEIGWGEIVVSPHDDDPLFSHLPGLVRVLHWHGETFELPDSGVHLASSSAYRNQAFRAGRCAWGLQFHLEVDAGAVAGFVATFADEARVAGVEPDRILAETPDALAALAPHRSAFLDAFAQLIAAPVPAAGVFPLH